MKEEGNKLFDERAIMSDMERNFNSRARIGADELPSNFHDRVGRWGDLKDFESHSGVMPA